MARRSKRGLVAAIAATAALVLAACGGDGDGDSGGSSSSGDAVEITVGKLVPLTGPSVEGSAPQADAFDLAVEYVNAQGKVKINVIEVDSKSTPEGAVPAFQAAVSQGADVIIQTGAGSPTAMAVAAAAASAKKIHMSANHAQLSSVNPLGFNTQPLGSVQTGLALDALLEEHPEIKTAVLVAPDNYDLGINANKARRPLLEAKGIEILLEETVPGTAADLSANAGKYASLKPDLLISDMAEGSSSWAQQVRDAGFEGVRFFGSSVATSTIVGQAPAAYEGGYTYQSWNPANDDLTETGKRFAEDYLEKTGEIADGFAASQYDGVLMLAAAVEATGSTDSETLAEWMRTNTGPEGAAMDELKFTEDQAFNSPILLVSLTGGELIPVRGVAAD